MKPITHAALLLDKSGSMAETRDMAVEGFNEQVEQLIEDSADQDIFVYLVTFNGNVYEHLWGVPAKELTRIDPKDYIPNGGTAMLDAQGFTIQKLIDTTDWQNPNHSYLMKIISDGKTRDDQHYTRATTKQLIQSCEATGRWTFNLCGCGKEYLEEIARDTGIPLGNMAAWTQQDLRGGGSAKDNAVFKNMRSRQKKYFDERKFGFSASSNYAADESCVADFSKELPPVEAVAFNKSDIVKPEDLPKVDLLTMKGKFPQYTTATNHVWKGGSLMGVSNRVEWRS